MKRLVTLLVFCLVSNWAVAQGWEKMFPFRDTTYNSLPVGFEEVEDNKFILAVCSTNNQEKKLFLTVYKLDDKLKIVWSKEISISYYDFLYNYFYGYYRLQISKDKKKYYIQLYSDNFENSKKTATQHIVFSEEGNVISKFITKDKGSSYMLFADEDDYPFILCNQLLKDSSFIFLEKYDINGNMIGTKKLKNAHKSENVLPHLTKNNNGELVFTLQEPTLQNTYSAILDKNLNISDSLYYFKYNFFVMDRIKNGNYIHFERYNGWLRYKIFKNDKTLLRFDSVRIENMWIFDSNIKKINDDEFLFSFYGYSNEKDINDYKKGYFGAIKFNINKNKKIWSKRLFLENPLDWYWTNHLSTTGNIYYWFARLNTKQTAGFPVLSTIDTNDVAFFNNIFGKVQIDKNKNCKIDSLESFLPNQIIKASTKNGDFFAQTDKNGAYLLDIAADTAIINVETNPLWKSCLPNTKVIFSDTATVNTLDIPLQPLINCPLLEVSLSTQRLRRCFDNNYNVQYCNKGTVSAQNAYVEVDFDQYLEVKSASIGYTKLTGNKYRFDVGNVAISECKSFDVKVYVNCDSTVLGQTHCSTAHIFPDSICVDNSLWDGSNISLTSRCNGEKVVFDVQNIGEKPTSKPIDWIVIEDQIMIKAANTTLGANEIKSFEFPANGKTLQFIASQATNHPSGNAFVKAAIEGCKGFNSLGFVTQTPDYDYEPAIDIDCRQNIGAYDPNEKLPSPIGVGSQRNIAPNTDIEYQINFQNEGTDTAFTVVLRDTLDKLLNVSTLRMGASSHLYTWELSGQGNLKVIFNNIHLTTKKENEAKSQCFVRFTISQKADNQIGKFIRNRAGIYFDFNPPIITNTTQHRIGKELYTMAVSDNNFENKDLKVTISPNPFQQKAVFEITSESDEIFTLYVSDLQGRLIYTQIFEEKQLIFEKNLSQGFYIYKIKGSKGHERTGKMVCGFQ